MTVRIAWEGEGSDFLDVGEAIRIRIKVLDSNQGRCIAPVRQVVLTIGIQGRDAVRMTQNAGING